MEMEGMMEGGDAPAEMMMDPPAEEMMEPAPAEEQPKEDNKLLAVPGMGLLGGDDDATDITEDHGPVMTPCCCCECACSNKLTEDQTCMGCLPIKCGTITIGIFTFCSTIFQVIYCFLLTLNEYVHWWYPFVYLILLSPAIIGTCFFIGYFTKDCKRTRGNLRCALILALISQSLIVVWCIIYYMWLNKRDGVYQGIGEDTSTYTKSSKKAYFFVVLAEATIFITLYSYFICVVAKYVSLYPKEEEEKEEEKKD